MRRLCLTVLSIALSVLAPLRAQVPRLDVSEKALTAAAISYVAAYEKQFAYLIADESYTQNLYDANNRHARTRVMKSELFLTYLPGDAEWIAVRDVMEVDGVPVKDREDLRALLMRKDQALVLKDVIARNARYNIGQRVTRNFNEPTLPLLLLEPKRVSRVRFDRKDVMRDGDTTLATLAFEERDSPTLVQTYNGPAKSKGEFLIDARTGAIRHTLFQIAHAGFTVRLETSYFRDGKLELWLPSVFTERYESGGVGGKFISREIAEATRETVECEARYSNYRRFEVTAKIK